MSTLTYDGLMADIAKVTAELGPPPTLRTNNVTVSHHMTEHDGYYFPPSRNRSKRIHKKLVKRFGGFEKRKPAMALINGQLCMHPAIYHDFKREHLA